MRPEDDDANAGPSRVAIETDAAATAAPAKRRAYRAPTLRHLGCVRDLTLVAENVRHTVSSAAT